MITMVYSIWDMVVNSQNYKYYFFNAAWTIMMLYGSVELLSKIIDIIDLLMDFCVREGLSLEDYGAGKGFWAVVSGSSDGVGKEMALQLADKGFNIVLLSRTPSKLADVAKQIESKDVQVKSYAVDFTQCSDSQWNDIKEIIDSVKIGVLVNNVAVCHERPVMYDEEDPLLCSGMVETNVNLLMNLTRLVVPQMQQRKSGLILNMGSYAAILSTPFLSAYSGTKGFVKNFSQSLAYELEPDGIVVSHIFNMGVSSKLHAANQKPSLFMPEPKKYVASLLKRINLNCGSWETHSSIPYLPHAILSFFVWSLWDPENTKSCVYSVLSKFNEANNGNSKIVDPSLKSLRAL